MRARGVPPRARLVAGVLPLALLLACGEDPPSEPAPREVAAEPVHPTSAGTEPGAAPRPLARITRVTRPDGQPMEGGLVREGRDLTGGASLETGQGGLVVDFLTGARIEIGPSTRARLGAEAPQQVILAAGTVRGHLSPAGGSPRPPLRVGTARGTLVVDGSGDVLVAALPDGTVWASTLAGRARFVGLSTDAGGRPPEIEVVAGRAVRVAASLPDALPGPADVEGARVEAARLAAEATTLPEAARTQALADADAGAERAIGRLESLDAQGRDLATRQRRAAREGAPEAAALQRQLVAHSQALFAERERALGAFEALAATSLAGRASPDPAAARRPLLRRLLGLGEPGEEPPAAAD